MADLVNRLRYAARAWPDRPAWTFDPGETLTFADVERRSARLAAALGRRGVGANDRVGVMLGNRAEYPLTWFALARLGATMVPLNARYRTADAAHVLESSHAVAVVTSADFTSLLAGASSLPLLDVETLGVETLDVETLDVETLDVESVDVETLDVVAPAEPDPDRIVNLQYTSGTTGSPKGCLLSHRYWTTLADSLITEFPRLRGEDVLLTAQPFSYVDPQWNVVAALTCGAHLVVLDGFHPSTFWAKVREHRVTYFYCLGAMPTLLLRMPPDTHDHDHAVRAVECSGIPPALHRELEERWRVPWYEAFGMTETGADIRVTDRDHDELVGTGCLGTAMPHRQARVVDGELCLKGPGMMTGYDGLPDVFDDGWFRTGDLARIDDRGRVYLQGRLKDMIRRSGENVAAYEVESVLLTHPRVRLAAVVGVPDELRGEEVKAFVVGDVDAEELAAYCGERLAPFKVPRYWEFRDELPMTASERVAKGQLR